MNNVNQNALYTNTQSLAYVTTYYAMSKQLFPEQPAEPEVKVQRAFSTAEAPKEKLRIGERLKAADSVSDHDHFHGDFDQDLK